MKNILQWTLIIILVLFVGFNLANNKSFKKEQPINNVKHIKVNGVSVNVELALTPESQIRGLSGRNELKEDDGMLFVFNNIGYHSFWMKDMKFPIDIIWIGDDLQIVYIKKDAQPKSYPDVYTPDKKAKYVLEVISGFSQKNNLKEGDKILFF